MTRNDPSDELRFIDGDRAAALALAAITANGELAQRVLDDVTAETMRAGNTEATHGLIRELAQLIANEAESNHGIEEAREWAEDLVVGTDYESQA